MSNRGIISRKLTSRDLVTTGIFSALYVVMTLAGGIFFAANPVLTFLMPLGCALLPGPVFLLLSTKVPKPGAISIVGVLVGLILFVTGMYWGMSLAFVLLGVVADFIAGIGKYKNLKLTITGYVIFTLSTITTYMMFFFDRENYLNYMLNQGTDPAFYDTMISSAKDWYLPAIFAGTIVCALVSAFVGRKLLKKQFEKSGIIA